MIYPITILFTIAFVFYSKYQFEDEKTGWTKTESKWHPFGLAMRAIIFAAFFFPASWKDVLLSAAICSLIFEMGLNVVALGKPLFYVGYTSQFDKKIGGFKWIVLGVLLAVSIIIRVI